MNFVNNVFGGCGESDIKIYAQKPKWEPFSDN